jgi:glyoxalase/bleomycin resistance protein/dioxygenase superfamily protein
MTATFVHAIKYVSNMGAAVRFHSEQLGLKLRFESPHWSEFETGSTTLALHPASAEHPAGSCELGFRVMHGQKLAKFKDSDGAQCSLSGSQS